MDLAKTHANPKKLNWFKDFKGHCWCKGLKKMIFGNSKKLIVSIVLILRAYLYII